ncbi:hypothetical protein IKE_05630 [Bacillus cereus VD196]|uniref:Uncharacterized protein n=1 Tax=Bacillus cereus VD196 TaxID=1053243 RepID=A0A9W5V670_BACCE|nr:hypothetical protein IKG_05911 [Bacillus cereus VD200]EOO62537.1 hypothetical protein IKE_05630 [Bacillus cereus VD196]
MDTKPNNRSGSSMKVVKVRELSYIVKKEIKELIYF